MPPSAVRASHAPTVALRGTLAVVLAGGRGSRLGPLTRRRAKPAVPFGGRFRIIDFPLSNCVNSGIRRIAVVTQYMAQSLLRHTQENWNFLDARVDEFVEAIPAQQRAGDSWYTGTADAVYQNLDLLQEHRPRHVLVLAGDHVYRMDYGLFVADHVERGAEVSIACLDVPAADADQFGVVELAADGRIAAFHEKPAEPARYARADGRCVASMGIYLFDAEALYATLARDAADPASGHDFGRDVLPALVAAGRVHAHDFARSCVGDDGAAPYWRDVGTIDAYYEASLDLTDVTPELNLYDADWPILTSSQAGPPAKFVFSDPDRHGVAYDSLVASGCIVSGGVVRRSLLSTNVRINSYAEIEDSVLMPDVTVGRRAVLRRAIVDRRCRIPEGLVAGVDADADRARFLVSAGGVVVITQEMLDRLDGPGAA